jgi:Glycosyl hydrolase family 71
VQPAVATLRASTKKVFAHYFTPFPVSLDNKASSVDYYTSQYLSPAGEGGKFAGSGGYIKQRPLPRDVISASVWYETDAEQDVRRAAALGIDGFAVNLLASSGEHWNRARRMLDMAQRVDPGFKMLLMPDMEGEFKTQPANVLVAVRALATHPAAYRSADGSLVLAPYNAQNQSAAWWQQQLNTLRGEGIAVVFLPVFQGWSKYAASFAPISLGLSDWGDRSPSANRGWANAPAAAHDLGTLWMSTVSPQDARPKDLLYWEARNSENYRVMWEAAIAGNADWVQIVTWNDYGESTEIAPSSGTQWSFYDLTAYYTTWFKTGVRPAVTRDVLYYFHRKHATSALPNLNKQTRLYSRSVASDAAADEIEVVVFAKAPGALRITRGGATSEHAVTAGMSVVRVPLAEGRPEFELLRANVSVLRMQSAFPIDNRIEYQDMLYRSGSSSRVLVAPL